MSSNFFSRVIFKFFGLVEDYDGAQKSRHRLSQDSTVITLPYLDGLICYYSTGYDFLFFIFSSCLFFFIFSTCLFNSLKAISNSASSSYRSSSYQLMISSFFGSSCFRSLFLFFGSVTSKLLFSSFTNLQPLLNSLTRKEYNLMKSCHILFRATVFDRNCGFVLNRMLAFICG